MMKIEFLLSGKFRAAAILFVAISLLSCEENDIDESGSANLKVVNAAPNSATQSFYLVDQAIANGLDFTDASDYITTVSGNRLSAQFRNEGSSGNAATGELYMMKDRHYMVYLRGGDDVRIKQYEDDLSLPSSNMARIRFLHFASGAPSTLIVKDANGDNLINTLTKDVESKYVNVAAGTLSIQLEGLALKNNVATLSIPGLKGGTVYTIYFTGSSSSNIAAHLVEY